MVEEGADEGSVNILEAQHRGRLLETELREREEKAEGVPIARDGIGACLPLAHEAVSEKRLQ